jgi:hypothetical protein
MSLILEKKALSLQQKHDSQSIIRVKSYVQRTNAIKFVTRL